MSNDEINIDELLSKNVPEIEKVLPSLSVKNLNKLHDAEAAKSDPRSTLQAAIHSELDQRKASENAGDAGDAGDHEASSSEAKSYSQAELDEAVEKARSEGRTEGVKAGKKSAAKKTADPKARRFQIEDGEVDREHLILTAETGGTFVAFADADGVELTQLPEMAFGPFDYATGEAGAPVVLKRKIAFPLHGPAADVSTVWLLDQDKKPVAVTRFMKPLPVSGGRSAEIPAKSLGFSV